MKPNRQEMLERFFHEYASLSRGEEPEKLAAFYEESFLVAGPSGGATFKNDQSFLAWLRDMRTFNAQTGMTSMTAGEIFETPVGAGYSLATVTWAATFAKTGDTAIRFQISYLLRDTGTQLKVAAYISHEDQQESMLAHGLL